MTCSIVSLYFQDLTLCISPDMFLDVYLYSGLAPLVCLLFHALLSSADTNLCSIISASFVCVKIYVVCVYRHICVLKNSEIGIFLVFIIQIPKWEFFMLFVCKNSEMGIFLDNFHKIYQNGNYKREVIEMVTRMEYLQKLLIER